MFKENTLAYDVWNSKYRYNNETYEQFINRLYEAFKRKPLDNTNFEDLSEHGKRFLLDSEEYNNNLFQYLSDLSIIPGGSVLSSVGTNQRCSLSNCFVIKTEDSIDAIFNSVRDMSNITKRRGGVGLDLSVLRPSSAPVNNSAKTTTGIVPFMRLYSEVTSVIGQGGRRGALMLSVDINHPDSPEFITAKQDLTQITGANISVKISNDFMKAVENNHDYLLHWPVDTPLTDFQKEQFLEQCESYNHLYSTTYKDKPLYIKKISAKTLWDLLISCSWKTAEPGIMFWDRMVDYAPDGVYEEHKSISTNPCSEIGMGAYDSCRLISVNLFNCVSNPFTSFAKISFPKLADMFYIAQCMGDTLVDLELQNIEKLIQTTNGDESELWKKVYEVGKNGRRTGVGFTGYGDMLAALNVPYGDVYTTSLCMNQMMMAELDATIDLAIIEGAFPSYQLNKEFHISENGEVVGKNSFFKFLAKQFSEHVDRMIKYGRRNISWSTCPPTGSISILTGTSSGIEPQFSLFYNRRKKCNVGEVGDFTDQNGEQFKTYTVIADKFKQWMEINNYDITSTNIDYLNQVVKCSPWYQQCASDLDVETRVHTQELIQKYISHSISSTVNLPSTATQQDVETIFKEAYQCGLKGITVYRDGSRSGVLIKTDTTQPVKKVRPKTLPCKVMHFINEKTPWVAFVGLKDDKPFEIFTGPNDIDVFPVPKYVKEGNIIKQYDDNNKSRYDFMYTDNYGFKNILGGLSRIFNQEYWNYARFVSALLRSDVSIEEVVKIVAGLSFISNSMNNWQNGVLRCLKSYIKDGTKVKNEVCPECHQATLIYNNGCKQCQSCGYSQCL